MKTIRRVRPSNLVILVSAPFFIFLFASSKEYLRSLAEILGVEANGWKLLYGFLLFLGMFLFAAFPMYLHVRRRLRVARSRIIGGIASALCLLLAIFIASRADIAPFIDSVVANAVDPFTSELVVKAEQPRRLTPEAVAACVAIARSGVWAYFGISAVLFALFWACELARPTARFKSYVVGGIALINLSGLAYLLFFAHAGFATGLFITLRAAVLAYLAAAILGLSLAGMQMLTPKRRTYAVHAGLCLLLIAGAAYYFSKPSETFVLVGSLDKQIAIVSGTPQGLATAVRQGEYEGGNGQTVKTRSVASVEAALKELSSGAQVSAAFIPAAVAPPETPVLWRVTFLPDRYQMPALALAGLGVFIGILTIGGWLHGRHPVAVGSEFFVDTVRGIPMLVIILYVGFPLSGAVKDMSDGVIDMPNLTRGIIALSIGYSAYMAEIFRAGINAVERGQIEAARSLGLKNWHVARFVVLPQALRIVIPPLGNELIAILKDTSLLSALSVRDLTQRMREFQSAYFLVFPPYNTLAIFYIFLTLAVASMLKWVERRYHVGSR
ncbi:MAG: amino acid ABC transporter permease [Dongiaceae bacterium]